MNEEFNDPRLVAVYDALNPWGDDTDFFFALADRPALDILDLGCGTGRLATAFARAGHTVVGADPSPAMLAYARQRPLGERVTWLETPAQTFYTGQQYDLITLTAHVFQFLPTVADITAALTAIANHLKPGGCLSFDSRSWPARSWEAWNPVDSFQRQTIDGVGPVESWVQVNSEERDRIQFTIFFHFLEDGQTLTSTSWLYFFEPSTVEHCLQTAGLRLEALYGDWDRTPFTLYSPEMIVVAKRIETSEPHS